MASMIEDSGVWWGRGLLDVSEVPSNSTTDPAAEADDDYAALAVMTLMLLLGVALIVGQILEKNRVEWMSEAGASLIIGILLGLCVTLANNLDYQYSVLFKFNLKAAVMQTDFFFIFLLPPIIFDAGFNLDVGPFLNNLGGICMLAFVGTAVSTAAIASFMWALGWMGLSFRISFFHASLFGAIISATDPVTVLAVFGRLHADRDLNALVFGESVMNDAVAIVLYQVISTFGRKPISFLRALYGLWQFVYIFAGSLAIGVAVACVAALLFRSQYFRNEHAPVEAGLVIILAYCSFYICDGIGLSGIVSIMFCGMVMAKYVRPNLSRSTDDRVGAFFRVIASLAEIFVFVYIGCALFTEPQAWDSASTWAFIFFSLVALAISRYLNVYPSTAFINLLRPVEQRIPQTHKHMLWFSGLRGAMAFALSMLARKTLEGDSGQVILTSTFFMVLITVLVNGGATSYMLRHWDLFDSEYSTRPARSPPPQRLQVLVPSRDVDDPEHDDSYQNGTKISTTGSCVTLPCHSNLDSGQGPWLVRRPTSTYTETRRLSKTAGFHVADREESATLPSSTVLPTHYSGSQCGNQAELSVSSHRCSPVRRYVGCMCRNVIESIHDFQRQGGLNKQLEHLDKVFSSYLIAPDMPGDDSTYARAAGTDPPGDVDVEEQ